MGLLDEVEKVAGAVAAVEADRKLDPNTNILEEGAAAVAGFEGTGAIKNVIENFLDKKEDQPQS